jgi:transcription elongation factor Elf1
MIHADRVLKCIVKDSSYGVLFKCNKCGSWNHIIEIDNDKSNTVSCHDCNSMFQILSAQ